MNTHTPSMSQEESSDRGLLQLCPLIKVTSLSISCSNTLERRIPKPPSSSPPSLPGSIDRKRWHQCRRSSRHRGGRSRLGTATDDKTPPHYSSLDRLRPGSARSASSCSGSRSGTLERKTPPPPPPTSHPPPIPASVDNRRAHMAPPPPVSSNRSSSGSSIGPSAGRMELAELIIGVSRHSLSDQSSSSSPHQHKPDTTDTASGPINIKRKLTLKKRHHQKQ